jgi:hypothetical protein
MFHFCAYWLEGTRACLCTKNDNHNSEFWGATRMYMGVSSTDPGLLGATFWIGVVILFAKTRFCAFARTLIPV